jgi:dienelactone hydrolase
MAKARLRIAITVGSIVFVAARGAGQPAVSPYDVTTYPVVWTLPEARNAKVVRGVKYAGESAGSLVMDLTYPPGGDASARWPAVVFVNGIGGKLNEWEIYRSWARLVAAHGLVGITAESDPAKPAESVRALFAHLGRESAALRLDASHLAVWACSANVRAALPFLMDGAPAGVRAAVILYGTGDAATLRKDLPVYWVLAGRDSPSLIDGQRALWARAVKEGAPWTMVSAPDLPHAFDGVEDTAHSRQRSSATWSSPTAALAPALPAAARAAAAPRHRAHGGNDFEKAAPSTGRSSPPTQDWMAAPALALSAWERPARPSRPAVPSSRDDGPAIHRIRRSAGARRQARGGGGASEESRGHGRECPP